MSQTLNDLPVGAKVKAVGSKFYGKDLIFRKLGAGHSQDPADSVILQTNDIISVRCFDAKEPNNSVSSRKTDGNNRYLHSNLLQWLNSDESAGHWYTAKHSADQAPDSANVWQNSSVAVNPYDTQAGFMNGFTDNFKKSLLTVAKRTVKNTVSDGGGYEDVQSKFFLLSTTEVGLSNENHIAEGEQYSLFSDSTKRIMVPTTECANNSVGYSITAGSAWVWWLRTPYSGDSEDVRRVHTDGSNSNYSAYAGIQGVAPACAISKNQKVSDSVDSDGCYVLEYDPEPEIHATGSVGKFMDGVYVPFATNGGGSSFQHDATKVDKTDISSIILAGSINNTGETISAGTWFYLNGKPCVAIVDIANGATFAEDTNYEKKTVGSVLSELNSNSIEEVPFTYDSTYGWVGHSSLTDIDDKIYKYGKLLVMNLGCKNVPANQWVTIATLSNSVTVLAHVAQTVISNSTNAPCGKVVCNGSAVSVYSASSFNTGYVEIINLIA